MNKKILLIALCCSLAFAGNAQKSENMRYEIECADNGTQGTYLVKVWVYTKDTNFSYEMLKKYAVHGVIFKGYTGKNGCQGQKPISQTPDLEKENSSFFHHFFNKDKAYVKYATEVDGSIERVKIGTEYKYGAIIVVSKDVLRKDLEQAGIIRGLSDGF